MLSLQECMGFGELDEDEVANIAEHEHIPILVALEMGEELLKTPRGVWRLHTMFRDNLAHAVETGQRDKARSIERTYVHFTAAHPVPTVL